MSGWFGPEGSKSTTVSQSLSQLVLRTSGVVNIWRGDNDNDNDNDNDDDDSNLGLEMQVAWFTFGHQMSDSASL